MMRTLTLMAALLIGSTGCEHLSEVKQQENTEHKPPHAVVETQAAVSEVVESGTKPEDKRNEVKKKWHQTLEDGMYVRFKTSKGEILCTLEYEKVPLIVINFAGLAEGKIDSTGGKGERFYDGLVFHRVIQKFMVQGGCPLGSGMGDPGYKFVDQIAPDLKHDGPGILSMANSGKDSNGSQFFITHVATPHLDGKHAVFGRVLKGQGVVNEIVKGDKLESVEIIRVGKKAEKFETDKKAFDKAIAEVLAKRLEALEAMVKKKWPKYKKGDEGLLYVVLKEGEGDIPKKGAAVTVHYEGEFMDGRKFDSSRVRNRPITFRLGKKEVIPGWDVGFKDMKKGEKRILIVPASLAYGRAGARDPQTGRYAIPPSEPLIFNVELLMFKNP